MTPRTLPAAKQLLSRLTGALPWLVVALVMPITLWAWAVARDALDQEAQERFDHRVVQIETAIRDRMRAYQEVLHAGTALFAASEQVTREEWRAFVATLHLQENYPGMMGMGYCRLIAPGERDPLLRSLRAEGFPHFSIWPTGIRAEYSAVIYLEPFSGGNPRALGYDMYSEPVRREAMERARDLGLPALSGKVTLVQETVPEPRPGVLMYLPVYRRHTPLDSVEQRRAALLGWVYAPFRMSDLMTGVLGPGHEAEMDVDLEIFDGKGIGDESVIYDFDKVRRWKHESPYNSLLSRHSTLMIDGHIWTLHVATKPSFDAKLDRWKPTLVLIAGLVVSALLFALATMLMNKRRSALALAREMTQALAASERRYRQMFETNQSVKLLVDPADGAIVDANPAASRYYGYPLERLRGMNIAEINLLPPSMVAEEMARARGEAASYFSFRHRLANGEVRDVEVYSGPVEEEGRVLLYSIVHDVTLRNQALAEQRAILETALVGIAHLRERRFVWVNAGMEELFGYRGDELRDLTTAHLYAIEEDYHRLGREGYPLLTRGEHYGTESLMRRKDGSTFWCHLSGKLIDLSRPELGSIWTLNDINTAVEAQAALKARTEELQEANHGLDLLSRMTDLLQGCDTLTAAHGIIGSFLPRLFPGGSGALYGNASGCEPLPDLVRWGDRQGGEPVEAHLCWAMQGKESHYFGPAGEAPRCPRADAPVTLCMPLEVRGERLGVLRLAFDEELPDARAEVRRALAHTAVQRIALSLANLLLRQRLHELTLRDPLTGLYNRRHLDEALAREVQLARRKSRTLAVVMIDIDHFKRFNDRFGHEAGDEVLRAVGMLLVRQVRATDTACRYGGEEFVLLLPETDVETACRRAERLRQGVADLALAHEGRPLGRVTLSLGLALFPADSDTPEGIIAAADAALYRAKAGGRDRLELFAPPV